MAPSRGGLSRAAIAAVVVLIVLAGGWWYVSGTPSYTLYEFYRAANGHDGERAAGLVDFDGVTRKLIDEFIAEQNPSGTPSGGSASDSPGAMLAAGLMKGALARPMAAVIRSRFVNTINNPPQDQPAARLGVLSEAIWNLQHDGAAASTHIRVKNGDLEIAMARDGNDRWHITALGGPALHDLARDFVDRQLKQMSPPSVAPPNP